MEKRILDSALAGTLGVLAVDLGMSVPHLARMALHLLDDAAVVAAHPIECRLLAERLDRDRQARSARRLSVRIKV